jgi:hypothetical protein
MTNVDVPSLKVCHDAEDFTFSLFSVKSHVKEGVPVKSHGGEDASVS